MCGVVGIVAKSNINQEIYDALTILQHRGQDAAGMVTCHEDKVYVRKSLGLVRDVFRARHMTRLKGNMGIGHVRYPTSGGDSGALAQPFYVNSPYGISLCHNGNLTNTQALSEDLFRTDLRHLNTDSDSEVLLNVFAHELQARKKTKAQPEDVFAAVRGLHQRCRGGYAVVALIVGYGVLGFRDPFGIRPLVYGKRETAAGTDYVIASESVALDALGYELVRDVQPGEAIFIDADGILHSMQCAEKPSLTPCIFEFVYLARPDSVIDGVSVYKARLRMGEKLTEKILRRYPNHDIDVVIPIPDTSRTAALPIAHGLGVKYREGLVKNRYIPRTFIMPGQQMRRKSVQQKFNTVDLEFNGKNVLLVDDSIVRGTTCRQIIQLARDAGAKKVYFVSAAPAVRFPNVYGIDMPAAHEFIAHNTADAEREVGERIGADWLIYQELEDLIASAQEGNEAIQQFECSVFDQNYPTGDIDAAYLTRIEALRNDASKAERAREDGFNDHLSESADSL